MNYNEILLCILTSTWLIETTRPFSARR